MKYKYHSYEKFVGLFIVSAILGSLFVFFTLMIKQNWLAEEVQYTTLVSNGDKVYEGSPIMYKGFQIGEIDDVKFEDDRVQVHYSILKKYQKYVTMGSKLKISSSLFGDKSFQILKPDVVSKKVIPNHSEILASEDDDVMKKMQDEMVVKVDGILKNVDKTLANTAVLSDEMKKHLPTMLKQAPTMTKDAAKIMSGVSKLVEEMNRMQPVMKAMATQMPAMTSKAVDALEETTVVLRAMQKTYFLRGNAEEAREELKNERSKRKPAKKK
jgi:phospholipid/cholesterol/gamma-HCH transport system substrate-binding protein